MLLIRVCQWIKLQIQLIAKDPFEVIRAGFRKSDKPSSIIPGMFKGQPFSCPLSLSEVQIVHLRIRVRHFVIWWSIGANSRRLPVAGVSLAVRSGEREQVPLWGIATIESAECRTPVPQQTWSRLRTAELASCLLRQELIKFPPPAVISSCPSPMHRIVFGQDADTPCPHKQIRPPVKGNRIVCGA